MKENDMIVQYKSNTIGREFYDLAPGEVGSIEDLVKDGETVKHVNTDGNLIGTYRRKPAPTRYTVEIRAPKAGERFFGNPVTILTATGSSADRAVIVGES